jgi:hypothetical protein
VQTVLMVLTELMVLTVQLGRKDLKEYREQTE